MHRVCMYKSTKMWQAPIKNKAMNRDGPFRNNECVHTQKKPHVFTIFRVSVTLTLLCDCDCLPMCAIFVHRHIIECLKVFLKVIRTEN